AGRSGEGAECDAALVAAPVPRLNFTHFQLFDGFPMPRLPTFAAMAFALLPATAFAQDCSSAGAQPLPVRSTPVPPLYSGMSGRPAPLASPRTILSESRDEALAVDVVLTRLRLEACTANQFASY